MIRSVSPKMASHVNKLMAQTEHWEPVLRQYITRMCSGFWDDEYLAYAFQLTQGNGDIYAAFCFAHLHSWIGIGKVLIADIEIGTGPGRDSEIDKNNQLLARLPAPFSGKFWGNNDSCDGYVKWHKPIELGQIDCTGREIVTVIPPRSVPLEVGLTRPDTTIYHILREHGLARWPYGSKRIRLFVKNPQWPNSEAALPY